MRLPWAKDPMPFGPALIKNTTVQFSEHRMEPLALLGPNHLRDGVSPSAPTTDLRAARSIALWSGQGIAGYAAPTQDPDWDSHLGLFPKRSFFHTSAWARVLDRTYGFTPRYFTMYEADSIVSMLPVMEVDSCLTGRRAVALPFTDSCEPLYRDIQSGKQMIETILTFGKRQGWNSVEIRGGDELFEGEQASMSFHEHI